MSTSPSRNEEHQMPLEEWCRSGEDTLSELKSNQVYLHGAGNAGRMLNALLIQSGITIKGFIDNNRNMASIPGSVDCFTPQEIGEKDLAGAIVIVSFYGKLSEIETVLAHYRNLGANTFWFYNIYLLLKYMHSHQGNGELTLDKYASKISEPCLSVYNLLEDHSSKSAFRGFINAGLTMDFRKYEATTQEEQYFPNTISFERGYGRFVDCGSFDGDVLLKLKQRFGIVDGLAAFEPDDENYCKLIGNISEQRVAAEQYFFPCGVWNESAKLKFAGGDTSSSRISDAGTSFIQCVSLDDSILDFKPTFVKMDIEGAELNALKGARKLIEKNHPDLAISVYHSLEHSWEIPLYIHSLNCGYRFYMMNHDVFGMETILYATAHNSTGVTG